ncbi:hypothetical protein TGVAND_242435 [Toxoplasma gondii VAND]|uniref:Uncharacterized protein n=1 Tax=Toxoplasma gondii VAND TaxID=933077 RepID=A0A086PX43_TOXGO|nr:hypothetical protein TGVAND_242435 [Toxoplasma gondii VAND]
MASLPPPEEAFPRRSFTAAAAAPAPMSPTISSVAAPSELLASSVSTFFSPADSTDFACPQLRAELDQAPAPRLPAAKNSAVVAAVQRQQQQEQEDFAAEAAAEAGKSPQQFLMLRIKETLHAPHPRLEVLCGCAADLGHLLFSASPPHYREGGLPLIAGVALTQNRHTALLRKLQEQQAQEAAAAFAASLDASSTAPEAPPASGAGTDAVAAQLAEAEETGGLVSATGLIGGSLVGQCFALLMEMFACTSHPVVRSATFLQLWRNRHFFPYLLLPSQAAAAETVRRHVLALLQQPHIESRTRVMTLALVAHGAAPLIAQDAPTVETILNTLAGLWGAHAVCGATGDSVAVEETAVGGQKAATKGAVEIRRGGGRGPSRDAPVATSRQTHLTSFPEHTDLDPSLVAASAPDTAAAALQTLGALLPFLSGDATIRILERVCAYVWGIQRIKTREEGLDAWLHAHRPEGAELALSQQAERTKSDDTDGKGEERRDSEKSTEAQRQAVVAADADKILLAGLGSFRERTADLPACLQRASSLAALLARTSPLQPDIAVWALRFLWRLVDRLREAALSPLSTVGRLGPKPPPQGVCTPDGSSVGSFDSEFCGKHVGVYSKAERGAPSAPGTLASSLSPVVLQALKDTACACLEAANFLTLNHGDLLVPLQLHGLKCILESCCCAGAWIPDSRGSTCGDLNPSTMQGPVSRTFLATSALRCLLDLVHAGLVRACPPLGFFSGRRESPQLFADFRLDAAGLDDAGFRNRVASDASQHQKRSSRSLASALHATRDSRSGPSDKRPDWTGRGPPDASSFLRESEEERKRSRELRHRDLWVWLRIAALEGAPAVCVFLALLSALVGWCVPNADMTGSSFRFFKKEKPCGCRLLGQRGCCGDSKSLAAGEESSKTLLQTKTEDSLRRAADAQAHTVHAVAESTTEGETKKPRPAGTGSKLHRLMCTSGEPRCGAADSERVEREAGGDVAGALAEGGREKASGAASREEADLGKKVEKKRGREEGDECSEQVKRTALATKTRTGSVTSKGPSEDPSAKIGGDRSVGAPLSWLSAASVNDGEKGEGGNHVQTFCSSVSLLQAAQKAVGAGPNVSGTRLLEDLRELAAARSTGASPCVVSHACDAHAVGGSAGVGEFGETKPTVEPEEATAAKTASAAVTSPKKLETRGDSTKRGRSHAKKADTSSDEEGEEKEEGELSDDEPVQNSSDSKGAVIQTRGQTQLSSSGVSPPRSASESTVLHRRTTSNGVAENPSFRSAEAVRDGKLAGSAATKETKHQSWIDELKKSAGAARQRQVPENGRKTSPDNRTNTNANGRRATVTENFQSFTSSSSDSSSLEESGDESEWISQALPLRSFARCDACSPRRAVVTEEHGEKSRGFGGGEVVLRRVERTEKKAVGTNRSLRTRSSRTPLLDRARGSLPLSGQRDGPDVRRGPGGLCGMTAREVEEAEAHVSSRGDLKRTLELLLHLGGKASQSPKNIRLLALLVALQVVSWLVAPLPLSALRLMAAKQQSRDATSGATGKLKKTGKADLQGTEVEKHTLLGGDKAVERSTNASSASARTDMPDREDAALLTAATEEQTSTRILVFRTLKAFAEQLADDEDTHQPIISAWTGRCLLSLRMHWPALLPLAAELLCRFSLSLPPKRSTLSASPTALACLLCAHASQGNSPGLQKDSFAPSDPSRVAPASANATTPALSSPSAPPRSTVSVTVFLDREESQPGSLKFLFQPALQGSRPGIPLRHALHVLSARRGISNSPPRTNTPGVCTPDQAAPDSEVFIRSWNSHFAWMNAYRAGLSTFLEDVGNMHGLSGICSSSSSKRGGNVAHFEGQERPWLLDVPADAGAPASGRLQTSTPSACAASPHASGGSVSPRFEFHADATGFFSRKSLYKTAVYAGVAGFPAVAARCLSACAAAAVTPETFAWLTALAATLRAEAALARNAGNRIFSEGFTGASRPVILGQTDVETALAASPHMSAEPAVENLSGFREGGNESEEQLNACSMHALPGGTVSGDACAGGLAHAPPASFDSPKERQQTKCGVRNAAGHSDAFAEAVAQAREAVREAERHWTLAPESLETLRRREEHFLGEGRSSSCGKPHPLLYAFTKGRSALVTALLSFLAFCGDVAHGKTVSRRAPLSPSSTGACRSEETPKTAASEQSTRATSRAKLFPGREMTAEASEEHAESLHPGGCARAPLPAHAECEQEIFKETLDLLENLRNQFGSLEVQFRFFSAQPLRLCSTSRRLLSIQTSLCRTFFLLATFLMIRLLKSHVLSLLSSQGFFSGCLYTHRSPTERARCCRDSCSETGQSPLSFLAHEAFSSFSQVIGFHSEHVSSKPNPSSSTFGPSCSKSNSARSKSEPFSSESKPFSSECEPSCLDGSDVGSFSQKAAASGAGPASAYRRRTLRFPLLGACFFSEARSPASPEVLEAALHAAQVASQLSDSLPCPLELRGEEEILDFLPLWVQASASPLWDEAGPTSCWASVDDCRKGGTEGVRTRGRERELFHLTQRPRRGCYRRSLARLAAMKRSLLQREVGQESPDSETPLSSLVSLEAVAGAAASRSSLRVSSRASEGDERRQTEEGRDMKDRGPKTSLLGVEDGQQSLPQIECPTSLQTPTAETENTGSSSLSSSSSSSVSSSSSSSASSSLSSSAFLSSSFPSPSSSPCSSSSWSPECTCYVRPFFFLDRVSPLLRISAAPLVRDANAGHLDAQRLRTFSSEFGVSSELSLKSNPTPSGRGAQDSDACDGVASPGLLEGAVSEDEAVEGADGEPGEERDFSEPRAPLHASTDPYAPVQTVKKEVTEEGVSSTEANEQVESARDLEVEDAGFVKCEEGRRWISSETTACLTAEVELEQEVSMDCSSSGSKSFSASRTADRRKCFTPVAENLQMTASFTEQEREAGPQDSGGRFDPGDETRSPLFFCWNEDADGEGSSPLLRRAFPRDLLRQAAALIEQCIYTPFPLPPRVFNPKCLPWVAVRAVLSGEEEAARGRCVFPVVMFTGELRDAEAQTLAAWAFVRLRISLAIGVGFFQQAALHGALHAKDKGEKRLKQLFRRDSIDRVRSQQPFNRDVLRNRLFFSMYLFFFLALWRQEHWTPFLSCVSQLGSRPRNTAL